MKLLRVAAVAALIIAPVSAQAAPNPIPADVRSSVFVKNAVIEWSANDAKAAKQEDYPALKEDFQTRLKAVVEQTFQNSPAGQEAVDLRINVKTFSCAKTGCFVDADVSVVQTADEKVLGVYSKVRGVQVSSGGLLGAVVQASLKTDVVGITAADFAQTLRNKFDAKK